VRSRRKEKQKIPTHDAWFSVNNICFSKKESLLVPALMFFCAEILLAQENLVSSEKKTFPQISPRERQNY